MQTEEEFFNEAMDAKCNYEQGIADHNNALLKSIGINLKDIAHLLEGCGCDGEMEVVSKPPTGCTQEEVTRTFTKVLIDQWSIGTEGDSFQGNIYAMFAKNKWLKIPYSC